MAIPAQTGKTSSIGLAIETTHRTAPITTAGGNANTIGITSTNPERFMIVEPGGGIGGEPQVEFPIDVDGLRSPKRSVYVAHAPDGSYQGQFGFKADAENLYLPLLLALGCDVQTTLNAGSGGGGAAYKHTMYLGRRYRPSVTVEEIFGDQTLGRVSTGCVSPGLSLNFAKIVSAALKLVGYSQVPNVYAGADYDFGSSQTVIPASMGGNGTLTWARTASPTYIDIAQGNNTNGPFVFAGMGFGGESGHSADFFLIDGAGFTTKPGLLEGMTLDVANNIQGFMTGNSGYEADTCVLNDCVVTGRVPLLFASNEIMLAARRFSKIGINFKITGASIVGSGQSYSIEVHIPHAKFMTSPATTPNAAMTQETRFEAQYGVSAGYSAKITLINTQTAASLASKDTTAGKGLGGWVSSQDSA